MIISDKHKFIFFHTQKTGGSTVTVRLKEYGYKFSPNFLVNFIDDKNYIFPNLIMFLPFHRSWFFSEEIIPKNILEEDYNVNLIDNNNYFLFPKKTPEDLVKEFQNNFNFEILNIILSKKNKIKKPVMVHNHFDYKKLKDSCFYEEKHQDYFKFCFVREPYDRCFSDFIQKLKKYSLRQLEQPPEVNFNNIVKKYKQNFFSKLAPLQYMNCEFMNFVGRFENFEKDFKNICEIVGIQYKDLELSNHNINVTPFKEEDKKNNFFNDGHLYKYLHLYEPETLELVNEFYYEEFKALSYRIINKKELLDYKDWHFTKK